MKVSWRASRPMILGVVVVAAFAFHAAPAGAAQNATIAAASGHLTGIPAGTARVPVTVGGVTNTSVAFRAGAALSGRVTADGSALSGGDVYVVTTTHVVLAHVETASTGAWSVGGLPVTSRGLYVCVDTAVASLGGDAFAPGCYGTGTSWAGAHTGVVTTIPDPPAGSRAYPTTRSRNLALGELALARTGSIALGSAAAGDTAVAFDANGFVAAQHVVGSADDALTRIPPGTYRVCVFPDDSAASARAATCDGDLAWTGATRPNVLHEGYPRPPAGTSEVAVTAGARVMADIDPVPGATIAGAVDVDPVPDTQTGTGTLYLFAGDRPVTRERLTAGSQDFAFRGLLPRTDWAVCVSSNGPGTCWRDTDYDPGTNMAIPPASPPSGATRITTTSGATTSGITLSQQARPEPEPPSYRISGTVRSSGGTPLTGSRVTVYRVEPGANLTIADDPRLAANGTWSSRPLGGYDRTKASFIVCPRGTDYHAAGSPKPAGTWVSQCTATVTLTASAPTRTGVDLALSRGGAVASTLRAGPDLWRADVLVADASTRRVVAGRNPDGSAGRAVVSGVPASSSGYLVCFFPENGRQVTKAHPTGLLPQCANGKEWYGQLVGVAVIDSDAEH